MREAYALTAARDRDEPVAGPDRRGAPNPLQHRFELWRVPPLPGRDHDGHGFLILLDNQVELGGKRTARLSQPVIMGLGEDTARWLLPQVALLTGAGRELVGAADR